MKNPGILFLMVAAALMPMATRVSAESVGQGQAVVTVLPKVEGQPTPSSITQQDLAVTVNGKNARVTHWAPFEAPNNKIELVLLIDGSSRNSLGQQMGDIREFVKGLPPNVKAGIAYMENGQAVFASPLTSDHAQILNNLRLPGGTPGSEGSPYFCLSDLAKHWPGQDKAARREVVMVTDGVDDYARRYNPEDPYVQAAINDAARAHLVVYSIYWSSQGRINLSEDATLAGQSLLQLVAEATGGRSFWLGTGNPVSFQPYFDDLTRMLRNQWELGFDAPVNGNPGVEQMKLKLRAPRTEIDAPRRVLMEAGGK